MTSRRRSWILGAAFALAVLGCAALVLERWGPRWFPRAAARWGWSADMVLRGALVLMSRGQGGDDAVAPRLESMAPRRFAHAATDGERARRLRALIGLMLCQSDDRMHDRRRESLAILAAAAHHDDEVTRGAVQAIWSLAQEHGGIDNIGIDDPNPSIAEMAIARLDGREVPDDPATRAALMTALRRATAYVSGPGAHRDVAFAIWALQLQAVIAWLAGEGPEPAWRTLTADESAAKAGEVRERARVILDRLATAPP